MNTVKVTARDGVVVNKTKNEEFGYIRVEASTTTMENGWLRKQNRSALILGRYDDLVSAGFREGQQIPGKIVVVESTTTSNPNNEPKINPTTGEVLMHGGSPIYRDTVFTTDLSKSDVLLAHDTVHALVDADISIS
jgi:hypothetical protein